MIKTLSRNFTPTLSTFLAGFTRRRSGIKSTLLHIFMCLALGLITLLFANGGGPVFAIGAVMTAIAIFMLMRRILRWATTLWARAQRLAR